jgi:PPM family protein phosphatase
MSSDLEIPCNWEKLCFGMNINNGENTVHRVESAFRSDVGRKRSNNEDSIASYEPTDPRELEESGCLYIVADGVGGAAKGERVSEYAAGQVLYEYFQHPEIEPGVRLSRVMVRVNSEINAFAEDNNTRMATTMVAAVVRGDVLTVANVGDSRAYLIRDGEAQQITKDHSIVGEMIRNGSMTEAEAQQSNIKNRLSRSLGGEPQVHVDIFTDILLEPGDKILLCSDGLTRYALREDVSQMTSQGSPKEIVEGLVDFALESGGGDNVSVFMIAFDPATSTAPSLHVPQHLKQPASWEDMMTEQPTMPVNHRRKDFPREAIPYIILGLSILLVAGIAVTALLLHPFGSFPTSEKQTETAVAGLPKAEASTVITATTEPMLSAVSSTAAASTNVPVAQAPAIDPAGPTLLPSATSAPFGESVCVVKTVNPGEGIGFYLEKFTAGKIKLYYDPAETYYHCSVPNLNPDDPPNECSEKVKIENGLNNYPNIKVDMWLVIPVDNPEDCTSGHGYWIPFLPAATPIPPEPNAGSSLQ